MPFLFGATLSKVTKMIQECSHFPRGVRCNHAGIKLSKSARNPLMGKCRWLVHAVPVVAQWEEACVSFERLQVTWKVDPLTTLRDMTTVLH